MSSGYSLSCSTGGRERSDETVGGVGVHTVLRSATHGLQTNRTTGVRHLPLAQSGTTEYRNFVVFVVIGNSEHDEVF